MTGDILFSLRDVAAAGALQLSGDELAQDVLKACASFYEGEIALLGVSDDRKACRLTNGGVLQHRGFRDVDVQPRKIGRQDLTEPERHCGMKRGLVVEAMV